MDPTRELILLRPSFSPLPLTPQIPAPFTFNNQIYKFTSEIKLNPKNEMPAPVFVDIESYNRLQENKDKFQNPRFRQIRLLANPFEQISKSIFMNRAAIKLANIDAVLRLTNHTGGYFAQQTPGKFSFCDLAGGPGAWTQYIQYRRSNSHGFGITLKSENIPGNAENLDWDTEKLDLDIFTISYGEDGTGDLYTNGPAFASFVKKTEVLGVDLAMADGGFELQAGQERYQEPLSSRLILSELLTGLMSLRIGGHMVVKVFDTVTKFMADLIFIVASCFESVWLFKPISSRPANAEKYLVGKGCKGNIEEYIALLLQAYSLYTESTSVTQLVSQLPPNFVSWLTEMNNLHLNEQHKAVDHALALLNDQPSSMPQYNLHKALILWNLPGNIDKM